MMPENTSAYQHQQQVDDHLASPPTSLNNPFLQKKTVFSDRSNQDGSTSQSHPTLSASTQLPALSQFSGYTYEMQNGNKNKNYPVFAPKSLARKLSLKLTANMGGDFLDASLSPPPCYKLPSLPSSNMGVPCRTTPSTYDYALKSIKSTSNPKKIESHTEFHDTKQKLSPLESSKPHNHNETLVQTPPLHTTVASFFTGSEIDDTLKSLENDQHYDASNELETDSISSKRSSIFSIDTAPTSMSTIYDSPMSPSSCRFSFEPCPDDVLDEDPVEQEDESDNDLEVIQEPLVKYSFTEQDKFNSILSHLDNFQAFLDNSLLGLELDDKELKLNNYDLECRIRSGPSSEPKYQNDETLTYQVEESYKGHPNTSVSPNFDINYPFDSGSRSQSSCEQHPISEPNSTSFAHPNSSNEVLSFGHNIPHLPTSFSDCSDHIDDSVKYNLHLSLNEHPTMRNTPFSSEEAHSDSFNESLSLTYSDDFCSPSSLSNQYDYTSASKDHNSKLSRLGLQFLGRTSSFSSSASLQSPKNSHRSSGSQSKLPSSSSSSSLHKSSIANMRDAFFKSSKSSSLGQNKKHNDPLSTPVSQFESSGTNNIHSTKREMTRSDSLSSLLTTTSELMISKHRANDTFLLPSPLQSSATSLYSNKGSSSASNRSLAIPFFPHLSVKGESSQKKKKRPSALGLKTAKSFFH